MKTLLIMFTPYRAIQIQISALVAYLKKHGNIVDYQELYIFTGEDFEKHKETVREKLLAFKPNIVGFSTYDMNYEFNISCAEFIKSFNPNIKTIAGGHSASVAPEHYLKHESLDFVCKGEGEETLVELLKALENNTTFADIKGLYWKKNNQEVVTNEARPLIVDLDSLPFLDRLAVHEQQLKLDYLPMVVGRGCPYKCDYCANETMKDLAPNQADFTRWRSPESTIAEIKECQKNYNFDTVYFYDDVFCLKLDWLEKFSELYKTNFPNMPYRCLLRPEMANDERRIKLLAESGCYLIDMGVESGSYEYRRRMLGRNMSNELIENAVSIMDKYNIKMSAFLMTGMPDESIEDMWKSIKLLFKLRPVGVQTGIFYPLLGTPNYHWCVENDMIDWEKRKKMVVYTYDTCLKVPLHKRLFIIASKWILSGMPHLCRFNFRMLPRFFKIQYRLWVEKRVDYS